MADTALFMGRRKLMTDYLPASMMKSGKEAPLLDAEGVASVIKAVWQDHELNAFGDCISARLLSWQTGYPHS